MEPSSSKILIDSCFPDSVRDDFKFIDTLNLVVGEDYDTVPMLEKQAARSIVRRAMTERKEQVLQVFQPNSPEAYLPIILGHCDFATEFVMMNLTYGSEANFSVEREELLFDTGAGGQFKKSLECQPVPVEKTFEIVRLLLSKNIEKVTVELNVQVVLIEKMTLENFVDFHNTIFLTIHGEFEDEYVLEHGHELDNIILTFTAEPIGD